MFLVLRRILDSAWLYFGLAAVLIVVGVLSQIELEAPGLEEVGAEELLTLRDRDDINVLFILVDTLRADRLQPYGYKRKTSPHLDALAKRGIVFKEVESQSSWTKASMASMWLGMYPERSGVQRFMHGVPQEATMPAEVFKEDGYTTAGIWRNGWVANNFGFDQGFDFYYRPSRNRPVNAVRPSNPSVYRIAGTDLDATESAMEFMLSHQREKFFLYVHYMDVHQYLYADSSPSFGTDFPDIYDASIHWTDRNIQLLIDMLEETRMLDRTLVVISADHGEAFWEHGIEGHARNLYREVTHVPWIILPPFEMDRIDVDERVANVDIWPTIYDLLGLEGPAEMDGKSVLPLILESAGIPNPEAAALHSRTLFSQLDRTWGMTDRDPNPIVAAVHDDYRYVEFTQKPEKGELFDRRDDVLEKKNIAKDRPEVKEEFQAAIEEFLARPAPGWSAVEVELDEMKRNQLRALGYVLPASERRKRERDEGEEGETAATEADGQSTDGSDAQAE
jgi:arylsulfatase